jgi:hypothetical protein
MGIRLFAWIGRSNEKPRVKHMVGLPPELTDGEDHRVMLPCARFLIMEEETDGTF